MPRAILESRSQQGPSTVADHQGGEHQGW